MGIHHTASARPSRWAALLLSALALPALGQAWQRVLHQNDSPGSAIGGGSGNTLFAGLTSGHVFRSTDNGLTWTLASDGLIDSFGRLLLPKAFVVTPSGRVIRAGDNASWENRVGSPIFYSDNSGQTWTEARLPFASPTRNPAGIGASDVVVHQGALYFSDLLSEGVWKSTNDGLSWTAAGEGLPTAPFVNFAKTYYAVASAGNALLTVQASKGVFRSLDGGATWTQAVEGIPGVVDSPLVGGRTWNASDVVGAPDGTAYAISDARLYRSRDAGATWTEIGQGVLESPNPFVPSVILPSARKVEVLGDRLFVSSGDANPRFFEGTPSGDSWTELPQVAGNNGNASLLAQSFYAHNGALYFAGGTGVYRLDLAAAVRTPIAPKVAVTSSGPYVANVGGTLQAGVRISGTAPFHIEWQLDGQPIAGQTSVTLNWPATATNQAGTLSVIVRNSAGAVTNTLGALAVAPTGPGRIDYSFRPIVSANIGAVTVNTFAFAPDGSVFLGGGLYSQTETYTGVRKVFADGRVDSGFVTGALIGSGSGPGASQGLTSTVLPLGDGSVLVGAAGTSDGQRYYRRLLPNGAQDPAWPWPNEIPGGPRKLLRLPDGRFLIAGGSLGGIHRLNADGSFDPTFQGPASIGRFQRNYVRDVAVLPDGRILIAGFFNDVDGVARVGLARLLPDGALDRGWVPAALPNGSEVNALTLLPDGKILIGGAFVTVGGEAHRNLARLHPDGTVDSTLGDLIPNTSPAGVVNAFAVQPDGRVWVGGAFVALSGRTYLFRLNTDGTLDSTFPDVGFTPGQDGGIRQLTLTPDGKLWIGCAVTSVAGYPAGQLFRIFTDLAGPTLGYAGLDQTPNLGTPVGLHATVTGPFSGLQWRRNGMALPGQTGLSLNLGPATLEHSGAYDLEIRSPGGTYLTPAAQVRVRGPVVIDHPPLPVVGVISNTVSFAVSAFGQLPLTYQWFHEGTALANATNRTLALTNLQVIQAGDYTVRVVGADQSSVESAPAYLTVIPPPGSIDPGFRPALFSSGFTRFNDIEFLPDGRVLVVGSFSTGSAGGPMSGLARLEPDGTVDTEFAFDSNGISEFLAVERQPDGRLVLLVRLASGSGPYVVRRLLENGTPDSSFAEGEVHYGSDLRLDPQGGVLVVSQGGLQRFLPDGTPDAAFNQRARLNGEARSVSIDPVGRLYVAGYFTTVGGQPQAQLARLLPDGTLDSGFKPTQTFSSQWTVAALADGVLVGDLNGFYRFNEVGESDSSYGWNSRLAAWDRTPGGGLVGALATTAGDGVLRQADGNPALPFSQLKLPKALYGYSFLRTAPDGSFWVALGNAGGAVDPTALLFKLHGSITPLAFLEEPRSKVALPGETLTLTAAATGTSRVAYQWHRNNVPLPGETNASLVLPSLTPERTGNYTVVAANRAGSLTSRTAVIELLLPPVIRQEPASRVVSPRSPAEFTVDAVGLQLRYQWQTGGTNLPGATNSTFTLPAVSPGDAGRYVVRITNPAGETVSREAALRVRPEPRTGAGEGPTQGLVARMRFENSINEDATRIVTSQTGTPGFVEGTEGDHAIRLRTGQDWVRLGTGTGAAGRLVDDTYTVSFWIRPESNGSLNVYSLILLTPGATPGTFTAREHYLFLGGNDTTVQGNRIFLATRTFTSVHSSDDRAYVPNLVGRWTHFAVVYRGTSPASAAQFTVYINGEPVPLTDSTFSVGGLVSLVNGLGRYGGGVYGTSAPFQLDDFRVYNRPLDAAEVESLIQPPTVEPAPEIVTQPMGGRLPAGASAELRVAATGANLFYEWYRGETLLPDADGPTLTLAAVGLNDAGSYRVVISNGGGRVESLAANLEVEAAADPFAAWASALGLSGPDADPSADLDGDGNSNLAEFVHGTSPTQAGDRPAFSGSTETVDGVRFPAVRFVRRQTLGSTQVETRASSSLEFQDDLGVTVQSVTPLGNGLEQVVIRSNTSEAGHPAQFFRITRQR